jgi:arsenite methyltransferase
MSGCCGTPARTRSAVNPDDIRDEVKARYADAARRVASGTTGCCGEGGCGDPITTDLYGETDGADVPAGALAASLGCGNPTALAELRPGEVVLDLGSGGGIDVLLTARRVGPEGKAYGLDMTDEMLELSREHQRQAGVTNAEFIKGQIEEVPLPDEAVDVVMSNCVVNLSPEKHRVLSEAYRVLRPGGRLAISDIVFREEPPRAIREAANLWGACMGGALTEDAYREGLSRAGFNDVDIEITREYGDDLLDAYPELTVEGADVAGSGLAAAFIRARKPSALSIQA